MEFWNSLFGGKKKDPSSRSPNETPAEGLQKILKEIESLSKPQDIPRKIIMLQYALSLIPQQSNQKLLGSLYMELADSLINNPQGSREHNIEKAIENYNKALEVYTPQEFKVEWAITHDSMADAYALRVRGNRSENIEQAIEHRKKTLEVYTLQEYPNLWADSHESLAHSYAKRIMGNQAENIEQAIEHYNKALEVYTYQEFPVLWAISHSCLADAYCNRIRGNRAENIEQAIEYYNKALEVFTPQEFPVIWAESQNCLAIAYCNRIRGNRIMNLERAIEHYYCALKVYTPQDFPSGWAEIQNNLANAYCGLIREDWADNIEKAIEHYNYALKVRTLRDFPLDWAETQNNLANAYFDRIRGDRAENVEQTINCHIKTLDVFTFKDYPIQWARAQNNLANAYMIRIRGDKAENIEQAIKHYNQAFKVRSFQNFPVQWAMTQSNLGNAYRNRMRGSKAENIELAIKCYKEALKVRTKHDFPLDWARSQNNLAGAYVHRIIGNSAENLEQAIEHYHKALEIYTPQNFPVEWARSQNGLASAYAYRIMGNRAENIEKAIEHYHNALEVYTPQNFPVDWAETQSNLANAYINRIQGDRANNIKSAISYFHKTLEVYNLESMPDKIRRTCTFLGNLNFDIGQWKDAEENYKSAIEAGDLLYSSGLSQESKKDEVEESSYINQNASLAAFRLGLGSKALLTLEGGKTRLLREALRLRMKQPDGVPKDEWKKYEEAAQKYLTATKHSNLITESFNASNRYAKEYHTITKLSGQEDYTKWEKEVQKALQDLNDAVKVIQKYNPEFQKELEILDILSIPDKETALLAFCITSKGSIGFVVSESNGIQIVDLPDFKREDLSNILFQTDKYGSITGGWIGDYLSYLNAPEIKRYDALLTWHRTLNDVLSSIGSRLLSPLLAELPSQVKRLILLPSGGLSLLPLHAVPLSDGHLLCQHYCTSYAPSIQLLREMQNKARTVQGKGLYAVINPQEDPTLVFSEFEGQAISKLFRSHQVSVGYTGTRATVLDRLPGHTYIHFSCHGSYNWNDPPQSGLNLVGGRTLSLADLQNDVVDMSSARLVTLSACETGITDILKGSAEEFVGLPAGFMLAGVPCVVSSLWSVPDISTAILMERFYSNHIIDEMDIPLSLQEAQLWVRGLTSSQVANYVEKCYQSGKWEGKGREFIEYYREIYLKMAEESPDEKPFEHPYYWAAFTVNGA